MSNIFTKYLIFNFDAFAREENRSIWILDYIRMEPHPVKKVFADGSYKGDFEQFIKGLIEAEVDISSKPPGEKGFSFLKYVGWWKEHLDGSISFADCPRLTKKQ